MKFYNLDITYEHHQEEILGDSYYEIERDAVLAVRDYYVEHVGEDYKWKEEIKEVLEWSSNDTTVPIHDTDLFICIVHVLVHELPQDTRYTVCWCCENIIWLFHDLYHVNHDTMADGEQDVNESSEYEAIRDSMDCCVANGIALPMDIIQKTEEDFEARFNWFGDFVSYAHAISTPASYDDVSLEAYHI